MAELFTISSLLNDANIKAYYRAEDLTDSSSNSKTLTKTGTVNNSAAKYNNGFNATFTDATNHLANTTVLTPGTGDFTIGCWFSKSAAPTNDFTPTFLYLGDNGGSVRAVLGASKTNGYAQASVVNAGQDLITSTTLICDGSFHLTIFERSGTTIKIFVDNVEVASGTSSKNVTSGELHIGYSGDSVGADSIGAATLDDVFIFNRVLTPGEKTQLFQPANSGTSGLLTRIW